MESRNVIFALSSSQLLLPMGRARANSIRVHYILIRADLTRQGALIVDCRGSQTEFKQLVAEVKGLAISMRHALIEMTDEYYVANAMAKTPQAPSSDFVSTKKNLPSILF